MSRIDATAVLDKLQRLKTGLGPAVEDLIDEKVREMQDTAVGLAPRRTGNLADTLARPDAIEKTLDEGKVRWRFGFLTEEAKQRAWYWYFVEFGTRAYQAGQRRSAGVDAKGRRRFSKVSRNVPARRAQPYLRPAFILFKQAVERLGAGAVMEMAFRKGRGA